MPPRFKHEESWNIDLGDGLGVGLDHSGSGGLRGWKRPSSIVRQWLGALWVFTVFKPWVEVGREGARVRGHSNGGWGSVSAWSWCRWVCRLSAVQSLFKVASKVGKLTGRSVLGRMLA